MAQQGKPGWYDDGTGQQRWWDGRGWTGYTQPDSSTAAPLPTPKPVAPIPAAPDAGMASELPAAKRVPSRRRGISVFATAGLTGGALLVGLIFGGAISGAANDSSAETTKLTASVAGLQTKLRSATTERDALKSAAATVSAQADQLSEQKTALEDETAQLAKRASKLDTREKKVAARESVVEREAAAAVTSRSESSSSGDSAETGSSSSAPDGATAQCNDGTYSYSAHRSGTCSHHGGVGTWL